MSIVNAIGNTIAGYFPLGEEIWSQTGGAVDAFFAGTSSGGKR